MNDQEYKDWLAGLKVGDTVAYLHGSYGSTDDYSIEKIEKITPTRQIKLDGYATKFKNGNMIDTSAWKTTTNKIVPITEEVKEHIAKKRLVKFIGNIDLGKLSIQQLRDIKKIINGE